MPFYQNSPLQKLIDTLPQQGKVCWIGIRPAKKKEMLFLKTVEAITQKGLAGDHFSGSEGSKRQVTLIQQEHLGAIASFMQVKEVSAEMLRRNLVIQGINLLALKDKTFWVGEVLLEYTGECHPCSRMEEILGEGGYNAVRGHGGITARILNGGTISLGDVLHLEE